MEKRVVGLPWISRPDHCSKFKYPKNKELGNGGRPSGRPRGERMRSGGGLVGSQRGKRCACATRTACITSSACVIPQNARLFSIQSSQKLWSDGSNDTIMMMLIVDCYHFVFALDSKLFHQIPNSDLWWSLSTITTALNIITIIINSSIIIRFCIFVGLQTIFPTSFQIWKLKFEL